MFGFSKFAGQQKLALRCKNSKSKIIFWILYAMFRNVVASLLSHAQRVASRIALTYRSESEIEKIGRGVQA